MPKMKTRKGLAKRVKMTGSGQLKRSQAGMSHFAPLKSQKQKRHLRKQALVSKSDYKRIKMMLHN